MKKVLIIIAFLFSSCAPVVINGVRVKQKPFIDDKDRFYCIIAVAAGFAIGTHFKAPNKK